MPDAFMPFEYSALWLGVQKKRRLGAVPTAMSWWLLSLRNMNGPIMVLCISSV